MSGTWPWLPLILLGAYHGLNPGMGWLFALARGLQEKSRGAVAWSLVPIALGHAAAIAVAVLLLRFVQSFLPLQYLKYAVAIFLFALGAYRFFRAQHPRGAGMRVGWLRLGWWSFLMASAHGAGLMVVPVLLAGHLHAHLEVHQMGTTPPLHAPISLAWVVFVHTASMLLVAGVLAMTLFETYEKFGLKLLRHSWFNFDLLWAIALFVAGIAAILS